MREYTVRFSKVGVTAIVDPFEIVPGANKAVEIMGLFLGQSSDFGDAQAEIIPYDVIRGLTTAGAGGAAATIRSMDPKDTAAGFTAKTNNTPGAVTGTEELLHSGFFNVAVGEALWLPEGAGWKCTTTESRLIVRLRTVPADELVMTGTAYVREM